jgi:hypothetical protein
MNEDYIYAKISEEESNNGDKPDFRNSALN